MSQLLATSIPAPPYLPGVFPKFPVVADLCRNGRSFSGQLPDLPRSHGLLHERTVLNPSSESTSYPLPTYPCMSQLLATSIPAPPYLPGVFPKFPVVADLPHPPPQTYGYSRRLPPPYHCHKHYFRSSRNHYVDFRWRILELIHHPTSLFTPTTTVLTISSLQFFLPHVRGANFFLHLPFCAGRGRYPRPVAGVATAKDLVLDDVRKKSTSYLLFSAPTLASSVGSGSATPSRRQSNGDVLGAMSVSLLSPRTVASCCRRITNFPESYKKRLQRLLNADEYNQTDRGTRYEQSQWQNINAD